MKNSQSMAGAHQGTTKNSLPFLLGALAGMVAAGGLYPYLKDVPSVAGYAVAGILTIVSSIGFGLLWPQQQKGAALPAAPVSVTARAEKNNNNDENEERKLSNTT